MIGALFCFLFSLSLLGSLLHLLIVWSLPRDENVRRLVTERLRLLRDLGLGGADAEGRGAGRAVASAMVTAMVASMAAVPVAATVAAVLAAVTSTDTSTNIMWTIYLTPHFYR